MSSNQDPLAPDPKNIMTRELLARTMEYEGFPEAAGFMRQLDSKKLANHESNILGQKRPEGLTDYQWLVLGFERMVVSARASGLGADFIRGLQRGIRIMQQNEWRLKDMSTDDLHAFMVKNAHM